MAFADYKNIAMVLQRFGIKYTEDNFIKINNVEIHPFFAEDFSFPRVTLI